MIMHCAFIYGSDGLVRVAFGAPEVATIDQTLADILACTVHKFEGLYVMRTQVQLACGLSAEAWQFDPVHQVVSHERIVFADGSYETSLEPVAVPKDISEPVTQYREYILPMRLQRAPRHASVTQTTRALRDIAAMSHEELPLSTWLDEPYQTVIHTF